MKRVTVVAVVLLVCAILAPSTRANAQVQYSAHAYLVAPDSGATYHTGGASTVSVDLSAYTMWIKITNASAHQYFVLDWTMDLEVNTSVAPEESMAQVS